MTVQNEVTWLINTIEDNWPGVSFPSTLALRDRDDSRTYYPNGRTEREKGVELASWSCVSVSTGSTNRQLYGTSPQYRVEHELDVRVQGAHPEEHGPIDDVDEFKTLVSYVQNAINAEITYPVVDTGTEDIGRVTYLDLAIVNETNLSAQAKDYYRTDFTVRMRGNADPQT